MRRRRGSRAEARGRPPKPAGLAGLFLAFAVTAAAAQDLLITNARLFDDTGAPPRAPVSIFARDGWIDAIGETIDGKER